MSPRGQGRRNRDVKSEAIPPALSPTNRNRLGINGTEQASRQHPDSTARPEGDHGERGAQGAGHSRPGGAGRFRDGPGPRSTSGVRWPVGDTRAVSVEAATYPNKARGAARDTRSPRARRQPHRPRLPKFTRGSVRTLREEAPLLSGESHGSRTKCSAWRAAPVFKQRRYVTFLSPQKIPRDSRDLSV